MSSILTGLQESYFDRGEKDQQNAMDTRRSSDLSSERNAGLNEPDELPTTPIETRNGVYEYTVPTGQEKIAQELGLQFHKGHWVTRIKSQKADFQFGRPQFHEIPSKKVAEAEQDFGPDYQDKVKRLGQLAKQGERKTVWDPVKRVYKTVPVNPPKEQGVAENFNGEYDDEAGMFKNDLQTIQRVSTHLEREIKDNENLPEWCQAKIAQSKGMIVSVMDYMISQHENGEINTIEEDWQKVNKSDKTSGMSPKAVKAYRRENPGSKLKTAVTTKPSKLKPGSKAAKRRKSFCARMSGNKGPMKDEKGRPTPKAKALSRWNCNEDVNEGQIYAGGNKPAGIRDYETRHVPNQNELSETEKIKGADGKACWKGKRFAGTEDGKDKCVPINKESSIMKGLQLEGNDEEHHTGGGLGTPYPSTYEQETLPYRTKGQRRTPSIAFENKKVK